MKYTAHCYVVSTLFAHPLKWLGYFGLVLFITILDFFPLRIKHVAMTTFQKAESINFKDVLHC